MVTKYQQVKQDFLSGKIKGCRAYFEAHNYHIEAAYCHLILGNFTKAKAHFEAVKDTDMRAHWGLLLMQMIDGNISTAPTYFEVRNFLEIDLDIFITYCKGDIVEKIVRYADYMAYYNMECYKFIGRAFWAHHLMPASMYFLNRACDRLYNDPELHYLLAYIYCYNEKNLTKCKKELDTCLNILPQYAPAVALSKKMFECTDE